MLNEWARQRIKVDLQIVAVALTYGADTLYTDDGSQTTFAELCGLNVMHTWNLPLNEAYRQPDLFEDQSNWSGETETALSAAPANPGSETQPE